MNILELDGATNITGHHLFHLDAVGTGTGIDLGNTLLGATVGIGEVIALVYAAAHHLEVLYIANMGLYSGLEEVE